MAEISIEEYLKKTVEPYKKPCFDSSLFIAKLNEEICHRIKRNLVFDWIWDQAKKGDFEVCISAITLAEVHHVRRRETNL